MGSIKLAAVIITYNPEIDRFKNVISSIVNQVDFIIIVDNGSKNINDIERSLYNKSNIEIINNNKNYGIGRALNIGVEKLKNNYDWILTLDQDSIILCNLKDLIYNLNEYKKNAKIGIISLNSSSTKGKLPYIEIKFPIISGSLVNSKIYIMNIRYREEFFMDQIDFDFDFKVRSSGFLIYSTCFQALDHQIGIKTDNKQKFSTEPGWRIYLMARNSFILLLERKINTGFFLQQLFYWYSVDIINKKNIFYVSFKYFIILSLSIRDAIIHYLVEPSQNESIQKINSFRFQ